MSVRGTWPEVELGTLGRWVGGGTPNKSNPAFWRGSIPWVSPKDMKVDVITDAEDHISEAALRESATNEVPMGAVLVVTRSGILEHTLPVATAGRALTLNQDIKALIPRDDVSSEFVAKALRAFSRQILDDCRKAGTTVASVDTERLKAFKIPLPPLDVQQRIVSRLHSLLSNARAARQQLEAVPALVEQYRQSVLAAAFRGDLTKEWREKNPNVEPASKLIERIRAERRHQWEAAELAKMKAKGTVPKDDKWKAKYQEPERVDATDLPALPPTWCWASVEELCPLDAPAVYGIIQPGPHLEGGVPYIRPLDVDAHGQTRLAELNRTTRTIADAYARSSLRAGDLVLSIVGTIGKVLVVTPDLDGANITQSSIRIRPAEGVPTGYLRRLLQSPLMRRQYDQHRFGNAVQRLNVEHVRRLAVPLAPSAEANAIAGVLEPKLDRAVRMLSAFDSAVTSDFERAILAKAFRGELDLDGTRSQRERPLTLEPDSHLVPERKAIRRA